MAQARDRAAAQVVALSRGFEEIAASSQLEPPDDEHDPEGATIAWERTQTAALLDQARASVIAAEAALGRLDDGTYGTCVACGRRVAEARLEALPTTDRCVDCAAGHLPGR